MPHINYARSETRTFVFRRGHRIRGIGYRRRSSAHKGLGKQWYQAKMAGMNLMCPCCNPYGRHAAGNHRVRRAVFRSLRARAQREIEAELLEYLEECVR